VTLLNERYDDATLQNVTLLDERYKKLSYQFYNFN